jgi:hypothetical protein
MIAQMALQRAQKAALLEKLDLWTKMGQEHLRESILREFAKAELMFNEPGVLEFLARELSITLDEGVLPGKPVSGKPMNVFGVPNTAPLMRGGVPVSPPVMMGR